MAGVSGTPYLFGVFGPFLQDHLNYSPVEVNMVGTLGNLGTYFNFVPGMFFDRFGIKPAGLLATALLSGGYVCMWLAASTRNAVLTHYIVFGLFWMMAGMGSGTLYQVGLGPNIGNFTQQHRGKVAGVLASLFGLSGAIFTQLYKLFLAPSVLGLFVMLAASLGGVGLLGTLLVRRLPPDSVDPRPASPEAGGIDTASKASAEPSADAPAESNQESEHLLGPHKSVPNADKSVSAFESGRHWRLLGIHWQYRPGDEHYNMLQMTLTLRFWLMFGAFFTVTGAGLTLINNLGSIAIALGGADGSQDNLVILLSCSNWLGRVVFGLLSDRLAALFSRPTFLVFSCALMGLAQLWLAFSDFNMLYFGVFLGGFAYGASWCTVPVLVFELFGTKHWGSNFAFAGLAPGGSSFFLASLLAGYIAQQHLTEGTKCYGKVIRLCCLRLLAAWQHRACMRACPDVGAAAAARLRFGDALCDGPARPLWHGPVRPLLHAQRWPFIGCCLSGGRCCMLAGLSVDVVRSYCVSLVTLPSTVFFLLFCPWIVIDVSR
eukprot:TRINITY_DN3968_c1_g4_i1.p1 TRINITY_DN3968_c1_g4~~TRINITY_DN3968_c1_g4_i1.p1  ORF type:complete len:588 (-),score=88.96 TRINITY_DN3968_c1_g4_i1:185-1819(-)